MFKRLKESLPRMAKIFLFLWVLSIIVFVTGQLLAPPDYASLINNPWGTLFGTSFVGGVIFFILMCISAFFGVAIRPEPTEESLVKIKKTNKARHTNPISIYLTGGVVILIAAVGFLFQKTIRLENATKVKEDEIMRVNVSPTPTPTLLPKVKGATVDSDPVIDCLSSAPNCNGESIRLKRSQCSNITCCGFNDGRWEVYPSSEKCKQAQQASQPSQPVQKPTTPTTQLNYYCYDNTLKYSYYTSSGEQCNKDNRISSCKGMVKSTYDLCMQSCLNTANEGTGICIWGYGAGGNVEDNPDLLQQCFDENSVEHQSCMDACSGPYQSNSLNCNNTP